MAFKVEKILDGETIKVVPKWEWITPDGTKLIGNELKITGYKLPVTNSSHINYAIDKLSKLLINREVVLKNPSLLKNNTEKIACSVFVDNVDVSQYFPEYKTSI
jgi:hypothetical protein